MISGSIARRYAKALMAIGVETKTYEKLNKDLDKLSRVMGNRELIDVLENPSYPLSKRKEVLLAVVKRSMVSPTTKNFVQLLLDRGRISSLPAIAREYQAMVDQQAGRVRATVTSAHKLDLPTVTRLKKALEAQSGKKVLLEQAVDSSLIGGVVTQIGSTVYDGSIRTQLEQLRQSLIEGEQ